MQDNNWVNKFRELKAFFSGLDRGYINPASAQNIIWVPTNEGQIKVDRAGVLETIRSLDPRLKEGNFKDNNFLTTYLKTPGNRERIYKELTPSEQIELAEALKKPALQEAAEPQPSGQESQAEEAQQTAPPGTSQASSGIPSAPAGTSPSSTPRQPRYIVMQSEQEEKAKQNEVKESMQGEKEKPQTESTKNMSTPQEQEQHKQQSAQSPKTGMPSSMGQPSFQGNTASKLSKAEQEIGGRNPGLRLQYGSGVKSFAKTGVSNASMFANKSLRSIGSTLLGNAGAIGRAATAPLAPLAGSLGNTSLGLIDRGANVRQNFINRFANIRRTAGRSGSGIAKVGKSRAKLAMLLSLLFIGLTGMLVVSSSPTSPIPTTPIAGGGGDISSCKFIRAGQEASYKSPLLLSYFQEASAKTGIPAVVLAAFTRVESPSSSDMTDDQIKNYAADCIVSKIGVSQTGALGIMQIQPPGTTSLQGNPASCDDCIDAGARLVGKTVQTMTRDDYCDPRTNIIVGSGWVLKKMDYLGYKNSGQWDPSWTNDEKAITALVNTYYGCLQYGGSKDCTGPFNYKDDVWDSLQNCKPASLANCSTSGAQAQPPAYRDLGEIGKTAKKNISIKAFQLGNGPTHVAVVGGMNGSQEQSGIDMVNAILETYKSGGVYGIPSDLSVYFIPEITPGSSDGFNDNGVDVNRNFDSVTVTGGRWSPIGCSLGRYTSAKGSYLTSCQSSETRSLFKAYCETIAPEAPDSTNQFTCAPGKTGDAAFSEAETNALKNFIQSNNITTVISYRAPYNNITSSNALQKLPGVDALADIFVKELGITYEQYFNKYPVPGQLMDWLQDQQIVGVEIELPDTSLSGTVKTNNLRAIQKALNSLSKTAPSTQGGSCPLVACPVLNGVISTLSYQEGRTSGKNNGHCDGGYGYTCHCGTAGRRAKAIDVLTKGQSVILPIINNQPVTWKLVVGPYSVDSEEGGGYGYTFQAIQGGDTWYLDMLHLNLSPISLGTNSPSGTPVATTVIDHVHMTIGNFGSNLTGTPVAGSNSDCDSSWLPSDFMCK